MNRPEQDQLLNDLLPDEGDQAFRAATLECGLAAVRRQRRHRQIAKTCARIGLPLLAALLIVFLELSSPLKRGTNSRAAVRPPLGPDPQNSVKVISDDELFALFPNRPLALVGQPGHQQLVFLDQR